MRRTVLVALACLLWACGAHAQADRGAFLAAWRQAAAAPGGEALADLTAWPFLFEGRPLRRAAFLAEAVPALFTPRVRKCLQRAEPTIEDGRLVFWCKPYAFYAGPVDAAPGRPWRLQEFAAGGE